MLFRTKWVFEKVYDPIFIHHVFTLQSNVNYIQVVNFSVEN